MIEEKRTVELNLTEGEASLVTVALFHIAPRLKKYNTDEELEKAYGNSDVSGIVNRICNKLNKTFDGNLYEIREKPKDMKEIKKELLEEWAKSAFFVKPMKFDGEIAYLDLEKK